MEMIVKFVSWISVISLLYESNDARRIAGGGSIYRAPPGSSKSVARPSLGRNRGGKFGRQTSSSTGFGFGLGAGLENGYGTGMINRPFGVGTNGYSYEFYHKNRLPVNDEAPLECAETDFSVYILGGPTSQDVEIMEGTKTCDATENICFGTITVTTANLTTENNESFFAIELRIVKGCELSTNFSGDQANRGTFDPQRKCWHSPVTDIGLKFSSETDFSSYNGNVGSIGPLTVDVFNDDELRDVLQLNSNVKQVSDVHQQVETCVCNSHICNSGHKIESHKIYFFTFPAILYKIIYF